MPANTIVQISPQTLSNDTRTNVLNSTVTSFAGLVPAGYVTGLFLIVRHIVIVNRTGTAALCALWKGATVANLAGTEWVFGGTAAAGVLSQGVTVPANGYQERGGIWKLLPADFIAGGSATLNALTIEFEVEVGVIG